MIKLFSRKTHRSAQNWYILVDFTENNYSLLVISEKGPRAVVFDESLWLSLSGSIQIDPANADHAWILEETIKEIRRSQSSNMGD